MRPPTVSVRPMTSRDVPAVMRLWRASKGVVLHSSGEDSPAGIRRFLRRNPGLSVVAESGRVVVGAVLCGHEGRRGLLHHLAVAPRCRRGGVARRMVGACLGALRRQRIPKAIAFVLSSERLANRFWQGMGWERWTGGSTYSAMTGPADRSA